MEGFSVLRPQEMEVVSLHQSEQLYSFYMHHPGGGEGSTAREILRHRTVESVVMCDIDEAMATVLLLFLRKVVFFFLFFLKILSFDAGSGGFLQVVPCCQSGSFLRSSTSACHQRRQVDTRSSSLPPFRHERRA